MFRSEVQKVDNDGSEIIIEKKIYEVNTQWIRKVRKYPNHETILVGSLV